ncbi:DUF255 domain-containing protein [Haladaptatus sp. DYSN1]|uniref:DUF255 domain-containing protein n=1 Tax=unclassified Haladaptatus TaxID=2622732 RepID=UPI002404DA4B|nr:DUF255 domain-containing protein [Haladaptatus sp. DYSN1]
MDDPAVETLVEWREWGPDAFAEADDAKKPLLLALSATWCDWCHEMDAATYAEPRIAAHLNDGFVPMRVDVDRQPRIRDRYNMGGFPSTVFLTPEGKLISGAGFLDQDGMRQVLDSVRRTWDGKGNSAGRVPRALQGADTPHAPLSPNVEGELFAQLAGEFDEEHGGWGESPKFPLARTIEFALKREQQQAIRTLDAIQAHLYDDFDGGFFRFAENANWSDPHREKVLDVNAALVRTFATAYRYTGHEEYKETAEKSAEYLVTTLWNGDAFAGSQRPSDEYYTLPIEERTADKQPQVDETAFADWNGLAIDALLTLYAATGNEQAKAFAERALDFLTESLVDEDGAVTHFDDDTSEVGLLADQARVLDALTTAMQVLGEYEDLARAVADYTIEHRRDGTSFLDGPTDGLGLLSAPLRPLDANAEFADALLDLAILTGDESYRTVAREAVEAFAGAADRMSVQVAGYATTAARLTDQPLTVDVGAVGSPLHRAALQLPDHEKVVIPNADVESGTATVTLDGTFTTVETPDELLAAVATDE